ncbi:MAG: hypothetical protein A2066_19155 [Bacteroidetes bacterium GWB2_41_8]|nr:MAG: hypothetical protein A2066_19155 [Bacteroidetes bacterium GWB2_41_8]
MSLRIYTFKDVVMLMAAKTILQNMLANLSELSTVRTTWTEAYVTELILKADTAIENFLGLDKQQSLREATDLLNNIMTPALRDLGFVKTQIEVDFSKEAGEMLKTLGLNINIHSINQEGLIQLLYSFKKGMTPNLMTAMTQKGTNPVLIDGIIAYANQLQQANLSQESLKSMTQEVSKEAVDTFNGIYSEVIGIGKIASKFYQNDRLKKDQFTFTKVVKKMGIAPKKEEEPVAP